MQPSLAGHGALAAPQKTHSQRHRQDSLTVILFLLPALVVFLTFVVYPIFQSVYYSLFDWKGLGKATDFIGLGNYANILRDQIFLKAVRNGFVIVFLSLTIQLPLALALALMVGRDLPGRTLSAPLGLGAAFSLAAIRRGVWRGPARPCRRATPGSRGGPRPPRSQLP